MLWRGGGTAAGGEVWAPSDDPPDGNSRAHAAGHHNDGHDRRGRGGVHASVVVGKRASRGSARVRPVSTPPQPRTRAGDRRSHPPRPWGTVQPLTRHAPLEPLT